MLSRKINRSESQLDVSTRPRQQQSRPIKPSGSLLATNPDTGRTQTATSAATTNQAQLQHRGSTTFQITMFVVSCLMAIVILAFCLFCAIIYTMRPNMANSALAFVHSNGFVNQAPSSRELMGASTMLPLDIGPGEPDISAVSNHLVMLGGSQTTHQPNHFISEPSQIASPYTMQPNLIGLTPCKDTDHYSSLARTAAICCDSITGQNPVHMIASNPMETSQFGPSFPVCYQAEASSILRAEESKEVNPIHWTRAQSNSNPYDKYMETSSFNV